MPSNPNQPLAFQKRRSPKKSTRPVVGPGREPDHPRTGDYFRRYRWQVIVAGVVVVAGVTLGLVFGLGGSSTPPASNITTTTLPLGSTTTAPGSTSTTAPPATSTTAPGSTTTTAH